MSKLVDRLESLSKFSGGPIGFHSPVSEVRSAAMLLIGGLSGTQVKEARTIHDVNADAGLILSEGSGAKIVRQMVEAMGDVPLGVFVKNMSQEKIDEVTNAGCDFVVFDIKMPAAVLDQEGVGRFLIVEPSLDQGLVRAINGFDVDAVLISKGADSFVTVEHMFVCRRFVELLEKPVIVMLPSLLNKTELTELWQAGIDGVVVPPAQSVQALTELKGMIDDLPRGTRGRHSKASAALPQYGGLVTLEDEEEEEEEE
jgi:hypothetical protein